MKKNLAILAAFLMAAALLVSFASCDDGSGTKKTPSVTSVKIGDVNKIPYDAGATIEGVIGTSMTFTSIVEVVNNAPKTVNWKLGTNAEGGLTEGTTLVDGLLTIGADEAEDTTLTVTATSTRDAKKFAVLYVELVKTGTTPYAITIGTYANGTIDGPETAKANEEVTLTIHPDSGYKLANIAIANVTLNGSGD